MKYIKLVSLIGLFSILLISCSKKSKLGKLIPKEAAVVIDFNAKSLFSKLPWEEIKQTSWYNELMSDSSFPSTAKTFLGDPAKTGVDMNSDIILFVVKPDNSGHMVVQGNLKDSKAFADFLKTMHPEGAIGKDGDLDIFKSSHAVIGWNNDRFVAVTNADHKMPGGDMINDSTINMMDSAIHSAPSPKLSPDNLLLICKNLFSLKEDNSLYENERFAELEKEEGDVRFWININELTKGSMGNMPGMMGMIKLDKFLVDNISAATINFENGKVTGTLKQYFGKELSDILKKGDGNINTDMVKRISSQNLAGMYAVHFSPANMLEIIKLTGLDGFINIAMAQGGITLDDVVKAIKGEMVFAVSDVTVKDDTANIKDAKDSARIYPQKPDATFLFAVAIGDKDAFNKLVNFGKTMGKDAIDKNVFTKSDDTYFVMSNSQDAVNKYFSGPQSDHAFLSNIKDHPLGGFANLQMILKGLQPQFTKDSMGKVHYARNIAMWNNAYLTGGEWKNGGLVTKGELNLMDKTTNSLKQLNKYIDDNAKIIIEKKKKQREEWKRDGLPKSATDSVLKKKSQK